MNFSFVAHAILNSKWISHLKITQDAKFIFIMLHVLINFA